VDEPFKALKEATIGGRLANMTITRKSGERRMACHCKVRDILLLNP
jgi:hypothetical protein